MVSYRILSRLLQEFVRGVYSPCCSTKTETLASFINDNKRIKGTQIGGDHEIKIVDFAEDTTILLRDIICLNRIQVILKLYEDTYSSKTKFSKIQA